MVVANNEESSDLSVTFKYGKGFEEPWAVFRGSPRKVRENLLEFFQLPPESMAGLSLNAVLIQCNHIVHGTGNAATILGGVIIKEDQEAPAQPAGTDPWAGTSSSTPAPQAAASAPEEKPHAGLISQIEKAETGDELKRLWAANKAAFSDKDVVAAYQTRGQAL